MDIQELLVNGTIAQRKYACELEPLLFGIYYFSEYFTYETPDFHQLFYKDMKELASGELNQSAWISFRESSKTSLAKIFIVWCICYKKKLFINYDSYDKGNSEAALFDIAVALQTNQKLINDFGQLYKRQKGTEEESKIKRINNFITENGVKVEAYSTQESTRGRIYKNIRPDLFCLDDIENSKTKDSYPITKKIIAHIDELKAGLGVNSSVLYLGNYIVEDGVIDYVMRSLERDSHAILRNIPVILNGEIMWPAKYVLTNQEAMEANKDIQDPLRRKVSLEEKRKVLGDAIFETEMMNNPAKSGDYFFDRSVISKAITKAIPPIKDIGGLKVWQEYNGKNSYGSGQDTSEGKGLDSNANVIINYSRRPALVVATYENNKVPPNLFAYDIKKHAELYGKCIACPEINMTGYATLAQLRLIYDNIHRRDVKSKIDGQMTNEYGFRTTVGTKYDILGQLKSAIEDGELEILDVGLLKEMYHFRRQDLNALKMEEGMTRHFDKLIACAIAYEMRKYASSSQKDNNEMFIITGTGKIPDYHV